VKKAWKHHGRVTSAKRVEGKTTEGYPIKIKFLPQIGSSSYRFGVLSENFLKRI
jgi:hypothetical protein